MPEETLARLADAFAEGVLTRHPTTATFVGDRRFDDRLPDLGPDGREAERAALEETRRALDAIDRSVLSGEDVITHHMLELACDFGLASLRHQLYHLSVDQMQGPQVALAMLLNWHTLETEKNARDLLARYRAIPAHLAQHVANLREGTREGRPSPRIAVERVIGQLRALVTASPEDSPYGRAIQKVSGVLRDDLLGAVGDDIYPAFAAYLRFLEGDYLPVARTEPGLSSIPRGAETYAELVRQRTQSDLMPERVHTIGTEELLAIHDEMRAHGVRDVRSHADALKADPRNAYGSREELLEDAQRLYERSLSRLPMLFGHLPTTPCRVIAIEDYREKDSVAAFYSRPPRERGRERGRSLHHLAQPGARLQDRPASPRGAAHKGPRDARRTLRRPRVPRRDPAPRRRSALDGEPRPRRVAGRG